MCSLNRNDFRLGLLGVTSVLLCLVLTACTGPDNNSRSDASTAPSSTVSSSGSRPVATGHRSAAMKNQSFTLLNDQQMQLSQYVGKVVVVDFWATYCEPCQKEAPRLDSLQKNLGSMGLQVIGLNVGGEEDKPKIPGFVKDYSIGYTLAIPEPEMVDFYMSDDDRIPQTFVFSRTGRMVKHFVGFSDDMDAEITQAVKDSLNESVN